MTLVKQPKTARSCGQAVVAMILGISLDEARKLVGHSHGTIAEELRQALVKRSVTCGDTHLTLHHEIPAYAILRASKPRRRNWHWMLMWDGKIFDPGKGWEINSKQGWVITSFIPITKDTK